MKWELGPLEPSPGTAAMSRRNFEEYRILKTNTKGSLTPVPFSRLLFQCRYIGTSVETLVVEVLPLDNPPLPVAALGPIRVHLRLANGECSTKGCNEGQYALPAK